MKRKILFIIPALFLLLGLLGPAIYTKRISKSNAPPAASSEITAQSNAGGNSSSGNTSGSVATETGASAQPSSEMPPVSAARKEGDGLNGPGFSRVSGKSYSPDLPSAPGSDAVTVNVAVVGKDGELLFGPAAVQLKEKGRWGATALGALDATGLPYNISAGFAGFVEAVAGQRNKGQAGWMYKVNEEIPMVAADKKPVASGDKVIWWYSKSMDTPPPTWEGLVRNN